MVPGELFGSEVRELVTAFAHPAQATETLAMIHVAVDVRRQRPQAVTLIAALPLVLHEALEGRDDNGEPREEQGGQEKALGLAGSRGCDAERVQSFEDTTDDFVLEVVQGGDAEEPLGQGI